jgi:hypothetical protein
MLLEFKELPSSGSYIVNFQKNKVGVYLDNKEQLFIAQLA